MKKLLFILSMMLIFGSCSSSNEVSSSESIQSFAKMEFCLPQPSKKFIDCLHSFGEKPFVVKGDTIELMGNPIYAYLQIHSDSIGAKELFSYDEYGPILWQQKFVGGITYIQISYTEAGQGGTLFTKCKNKDYFLNTLAPVIFEAPKDSSWYDPKMTWKDDSTRYVPLDEGVGCHYEISKDSIGFYRMDWYCGC